MNHPVPAPAARPRLAPEIVVDARCLQDHAYVDRGIGRHALVLLEGARQLPALASLRMVALTDPAMPPLAPAHRALFAGELHSAYAVARAWEARAEADRWFLSLSPMTHDPLFVARLLDGPAALKAAVVYDFIPLDFAERYLTTASGRIDYHVMLAWLARYTLFAPISQATASRLSELTAAAPEEIAVTGAPLVPDLEAAAHLPEPARRAHVLVVGGADPRKNVATAIRGHAACAALQKRAMPLLITGRYASEEAALLRRLAAEAGGDPALVRFPGHISEAGLAALYREAACVVVPSQAEGFSLPVIEGMAAGAPTVVSDIPAHAELVADPALRFPADDGPALAAVLERLAESPDARAAVVAEQAAVWPAFRAEAVARRFWEALLAHAPSASPLANPGIATRRRPRVAFATPLPPERSGVADFSATGCEALGAGVALDVYTETAGAPLPRGAASVRPLSALPYLSAGYDRVISVLGNSEYHLGIHRLLMRYGSACVAHDSRMLGFYAALFPQGEAERIAGRELGRRVGRAEIDQWLADERRLPATLMGEVVAAAEPLFVHSTRSAETLTQRFGREVVRLPFAIQRPWEAAELVPAARAAARARLGLDDDTVLIASFGYLHFTKAPETCLWALQQLRGWGYDARLHFVGAPQMPLEGLHELARQIGVDAHVSLGDAYLDEAAWRDHLLAADLGLQLRSFSNGAVSGALQDCISAGLASVANEDLAAAIEAPAYVARVPDALSPVLVAEALAGLLDSTPRGDRHAAERADYAESHSFRRYACQLYATLGLEVAS